MDTSIVDYFNLVNNTIVKHESSISSLNIDKIDKSKLIPLTLDEYNEIDDIDPSAFYFIIDKDDDFLTKFNEMYDNVNTLLNFVNQFPIDNRAYGIINRLPKYLNIPGLDDPRGEATDDNNSVDSSISTEDTDIIEEDIN